MEDFTLSEALATRHTQEPALSFHTGTILIVLPRIKQNVKVGLMSVRLRWRNGILGTLFMLGAIDLCNAHKKTRRITLNLYQQSGLIRVGDLYNFGHKNDVSIPFLGTAV